MAKPNFLVDAHEAALEDLALEVILGDGFFLLESEWQGKRVELWCKWASLKDDERLGAALEPKEDEAEYDYALRVGIEVCRVLGVKEKLPKWIPRDEHGNAAPEHSRATGALRQLGRAWLERRREFDYWLERDKGWNIQRLCKLETLKIRDLVAKELNTHPFDPKVCELSLAQMYVMLELRHPRPETEREDDAFAKDVEALNALDGDVVYEEEQVDAWDDAIDITGDEWA